VTVHTVKTRPTIRWRDSVLPLLDLRQFFVHSGTAERSSNGAKPAIITVAWGKQQLGLVVDKIIGKQGVVVKSLSPIIGEVPGLSGGTILGDGRIALIVDTPGLIHANLQRARIQ
jgi:two-component system chemotaxis sensor kinase CheA